MKNSLLLLLLIISPLAHADMNKWVDANGKVHKWVDDNGKVHYSDQPPPAHIKAKILRTESAPASTPAASKTFVEKDAELKKAQQAKKEAAEQAAKEQAKQEERKSNCAAAQQNMRTLQQGTRMVEVGADGERSYLDDQQRQQRISRAQQDISNFCQ